MKVLWLLGLDVDISWWMLIIIIVLTYALYSVRSLYTFWRLGIPIRPTLPIVGNMLETSKKGLLGYTRDALSLPEIHGELFTSSMPSINVRNMDIIKEVLIKDFPNFVNRVTIARVAEFPIDSFLTTLTDENWKRVRSHVSPTFSASKMKIMARKMNAIDNQLVEKLNEFCKSGEYFDVKKVTGAYAMDVIARTTFGLQVDTQKDPENDFVKQADAIMNINFKKPSTLIMFLFPFLLPYLKYFGMSIMDQAATQFFLDVTRQTIERRKDTKACPDPKFKPPLLQTDRDFIQLMIDAHKDQEEGEEANLHGEKQGLSEKEVLAQGLLFFLAGYDTTATTIQFLLYNLAVNPQAQEKIYEEICNVVGDKEELTYDMMTELTYLEMCLQESLRLYPVAPRVNRVAKEARTYRGVHIPAGMAVTVPTYALHMDPEVWPEPEAYRPERFLPEEKEKRSPYQWAPFGHGPRNCVGMRLAIMEVKMATVSILRNFRLVTGPETQIPPKLEKMRLRAEIKLKVEKRE